MIYELKGKNISATITSFGCMVRAGFRKSSNAWAEPLFLPLWHNDFTIEDAFTRDLRGDFFCVPFGSDYKGKLPDDWKASSDIKDPDAFPHGYGAQHEWSLIEQSEDSVTLVIDYPEYHPVRSLRRTVKICDDERKIDFMDTIIARTDCTLPVGIHPIFKLSQEPQKTALSLPECEAIRTFPGDVDATSIFKPNMIVENAQEVPTRDGKTVDATKLPLRAHTEELLMLASVKNGALELTNQEEKYSVKLEWDSSKLPGCLLWISNLGRQFSPWNGKNLCLGVEPIASIFDMGCALANGKTPIPGKSVCTLKKEIPFSIGHSLTMKEI